MVSEVVISLVKKVRVYFVIESMYRFFKTEKEEEESEPSNPKEESDPKEFVEAKKELTTEETEDLKMATQITTTLIRPPEPLNAANAKNEDWLQ